MLDLFNNYRGYLGQIEEAQRLADQLNMDQGILNTTVAPVQQVTPAANEQEGIFSLLDSGTTSKTNTTGSGKLSYIDILGFLTNPVAFGINQGIGALTGRTATDRISDYFSNLFGGDSEGAPGLSAPTSAPPGVGPGESGGDGGDGGGVGSGADEGGSGADSGSGSHSDPGD